MNHFASSRFWEPYEKLSPEIRALADKQYALLKANPARRAWLILGRSVQNPVDRRFDGDMV